MYLLLNIVIKQNDSISYCMEFSCTFTIYTMHAFFSDRLIY